MADGANIVLYDRNGNPVTYEGIETVSFNTDVDGKIATYTHGIASDEETVALDLSAGNQTVTPAEADFMKTVVIEKPDNLLPENIRKGETVAGIPGELIGETMSKEVELNFADGDQTVEPDPDTLLSAVIIKKPDNLLPENIRKGETVAGIPGTMSAGGTESVPPSDINFYDYDGTIVAAWTLEELAAATELPENPTHSGLASQGWNWTLEDLQEANVPENVGQLYITDDGKTRLYITAPASGLMPVKLYFSQTVANGVTIDWGDGSATETLEGTGNVNTTHTYASSGDYVISLDPADGCTLGFGNGTSYSVLPITACAAFFRKVEIGKNVTSINHYAFSRCYYLAAITIPSSVTSFIGKYAFQYCYNLTTIIIPSVTGSLWQYAFSYCHNLTNVIYPRSGAAISTNAFESCCNLTNIIASSLSGGNAFRNCYNLTNAFFFAGATVVDYAFQSCYNLTKVTIPSGVTSIGTYAFAYCHSVAEYHLEPTTPPTLANTNAFNGISSDCIIYVPKGCLSAYQSATNWSTYASQMQEEAE